MEKEISEKDMIDVFTEVEIVCKEHGSFLVTPVELLNGSGCPVCEKDYPTYYPDVEEEDVSMLLYNHTNDVMNKLVGEQQNFNVSVIRTNHDEYPTEEKRVAWSLHIDNPKITFNIYYTDTTHRICEKHNYRDNVYDIRDDFSQEDTIGYTLFRYDITIALHREIVFNMIEDILNFEINEDLKHNEKQ